MSFHDAQGGRVGDWPTAFGLIGTSEWTCVYPIPTNAATLQISPCNLGAAGRVEFRNLSLTVCRVRTLVKADAPLPPGRRRRRGASPTRGGRPRRRASGCVSTGSGASGCREGQAAAGRSRPQATALGLVQGAGDRGRTTGPSSRTARRRFGLRRGWRSGAARRPSTRRGTSGASPCRRRGPDAASRWISMMLQTHAKAYVDGVACGELWYPGGELELTWRARRAAARSCCW